MNGQVASERLGDERRPRALRWYASLPLAVLGGLALDAATPSLAWWPAALLGAALVMAAVWQQRAGLGALAGFAAGCAFWMPHISWLTLYLGPVPWLGLCGAMILWFALFGLFAGLATRGLAALLGPRAGHPTESRRRWALIAAQTVAVAGLWVLREQVQGAWPYGGFAWGRLAHTQAEGPLLALVSWLGFSGLTGLLALACAIPVAVFFAAPLGGRRSPGARAVGSAAVSAAAVAVILALLVAVPPAPLERTGTLRVAAVQGDSKSGIFDDRENGDVLRDHVEQTEALLDRLEAEGAGVDVIVWPENSAEFELRSQPGRSAQVRRLAERAGAPIVVGTILREEGPDGGDVYTNSTLVYDAGGDTGVRYDKRRPVPFAEYMPDRAFYRSLAPELVDLVQLEYAHGRLPAVLPIEGASGPFSAGIAICFDIIFDDHAVAMMRPERGPAAEVIFAQTNNADFGRTDESAQQLHIARLRAVETGRALVNISTVGTSAIVLPDGREADRLPTHTAASMVAEVPLVSGETPALRFGAAIAAAWMLAAAGGVAAGVAGLVRRRRA